MINLDKLKLSSIYLKWETLLLDSGILQEPKFTVGHKYHVYNFRPEHQEIYGYKNYTFHVERELSSKASDYLFTYGDNILNMVQFFSDDYKKVWIAVPAEKSIYEKKPLTF